MSDEQPARILVVGDERATRDMLGEMAAMLGYRISTASGGPEALRMATADPPDALLLDVKLPGTSGKKEFLFLFDYGDEWHFRVKFMGRSDTVEPGAAYPRVVAQQGEAPPQYEGLDEEDGEGE